MRTPPRILVVDDNPLNLDILQTRLAVHGYEIVTATDGEAALAAGCDAYVAKPYSPRELLVTIRRYLP